MLRCGSCDNRLYSARRENTRRYVCMSGPDHGGCGRLTVVAGPLEEFIAEAVLQRLDTPALANALGGRADQNDNGAVMAESLAADRAQLDELAALYGSKGITLSEWVTARKTIEARMHDTERSLARVSHSDALVGFIGTPGLRERWAGLNLARQHAIVAAVIDQVTILPKLKTATQTLDPARVRVVWRV